MSESVRHRLLIQPIVLVLLALALYASNHDHAFHLDSTYGLDENPWIESLRFIPQYFVDPFTLTTLRSNGDYRPILQISYALNYAISGREMWSWHLFQILLHAFNAVCLMRLCAMLLPRLTDQPSARQREWIPFLVAAVFVAHPTASGVVNYLWARSSLLTTAFLLPSIICFISARYRWAAVLYTLALFTKIEAVAALGVYGMWLVMLALEQRSTDKGLWRRGLAALNPRNLRLLMPMLLVTALMTVIRWALLPDFLAQARQDPAMTSGVYFVTQLTSWWTYVGNWWMPDNLVADHLGYPVYISLFQAAPFMAAYGWGLVAIVVAAVTAVRPVYGFLAVSALALVSPHSSFLPLTEMVNEHRPYLPIALLSMCWLVPMSAWGLRRSPAVSALLSLVLVAAFGKMTLDRNPVFKTWESYWTDTVQKSPSWRSHTNMGIHHLRNDQLEKAEHHFLAAGRFSPKNSVVLTNLGVVYARQGEQEKARHFHDSAVERDRYTSLALEARAHHRITEGRYQEALEDLDNAMAVSQIPFHVHIQYIHAYAGLGDWEAAVTHTMKARAINPDETERYIVPVVAPFWTSFEQSQRGIQYFQALEKAWPDRWWVHANIERLATMIGDGALASLHKSKVQALGVKP